jgi:hypothetical protein
VNDVAPIEVEAVGPAMQILNERQQRFVRLQFEDSPFKGDGQYVYWAKTAGYAGDERTLQATAGRLMADARIRAAIDEESRRHPHVLAPLAYSALRKLLQDPKHPQHVRAIGMVIERVSPIQTSHEITVHHSEPPVTPENIATVLKRMDELAKKAGVTLPALPPPVPIEVEFSVVPNVPEFA